MTNECLVSLTRSEGVSMILPRRGCSVPVLIGLLGFLLGGCYSYTSLRLDPGTDLYKTSTKLEKASIREYDTGVDPRKFRFVVLSAASNVYPARFEFFMRSALSDLGLKLVLNPKEIESLAGMHPKLSNLSPSKYPQLVKKVSDVLGPVMLVEARSVRVGDWRPVVVRVTDISTGRVLFLVEHAKFIFIRPDALAHYPVLNALREWFKASTNTSS